MRSRQRVRSSRIERSICAMPSSRPSIQTFVARNAFGGFSSPTVSSARPYIGDVSITRPPPAAKRSTTGTSFARAAPATSNVCHVPRPMTGRSSPELGIGRSCTGLVLAPTVPNDTVYDERFPYTTELAMPVIGLESEFRVYVDEREVAPEEVWRTPAGFIERPLLKRTS